MVNICRVADKTNGFGNLLILELLHERHCFFEVIHHHIYITNRTGRMGLIRLAWHALFGGLRNEKEFLALCAQEIWIATKHHRLRVAMDGEVTHMKPPLHYRVRPLALRVIVPCEEASENEGK